MREVGARTAFLLEGVSARAIDDRTLEVVLDEPRGYFPYVLASVFSFPWPRHVCERVGESWRDPEHLVYNGPFVPAERTEERLLLTSNPHWTGARGNVRDIEVHVVGPDVDRLAEWRKGRFDVITHHQELDEAPPDTVVTTVSELGLGYLGFNATIEPFSNELVRRAFAHGLDRERLVRETDYLALAASKGGAIPPSVPGHTHRAGAEFDRELARQLLAEAGHEDGRGLPELELAATHWQATEGLVAQLEELGARVRVVRHEGPLWRPDIASSHLWMAGWMADYPDPDGIFRGLLTEEFPFARDEEVLGLLARARELRDQAERMRVFHELDRLWVRERAALVPLSYSRHLLLRRPWIDELWPNPLTRAAFDTAVVRRS